MSAITLALLLVVGAAAVVPGPVIGILTQDSGQYNPGTSYLAASYVKFIESAGGRVVPVHYESTTEELTTLFGMLNGLLIPGGSQDIADPKNPFLAASTVIYQLAVAAFQTGEVFPIWGTCQGFQTLSVITNGNSTVLTSGFDSENLPLPLSFTANARSSRLLAGASSDLFNALGSEPITMNSHHDGVTPSAFDGSPKLQATYNVLSTNKDRTGRQFISTMEGKTLPLFATQWHPEKNAFEWTPEEEIPHTATAVAACQYMASFFVNVARASTHVYPYATFMADVIWNFSPIFTGRAGSDFTQVYAWNRTGL